MPSRRDLIVIVVLALVGTGIFYLARPGGRDAGRFMPGATGPVQGEVAPDFSLATLDGKKMGPADFRGKVVFLNFWATWCPPCREEMPAMENLHRKMQGLPFQMLAVSIDKEGAATVAPFVRELGLTFPVLLDPEGKVAKKYGLTGTPETFIINLDGKTAARVVGPRKWDEEQWLRALTNLAKSGLNSGQDGQKR